MTGATPIATFSAAANVLLFGYTMFNAGRLGRSSARLLSVIFLGAFACIGNFFGLLWLMNLGSNPYNLVNAFESVCWFTMIQVATYLYIERIIIFSSPRKMNWLWGIQAIIFAAVGIEAVLYQYELLVKKEFRIFPKTSIVTTTITAVSEIVLYYLLAKLVMQRFMEGSTSHRVLRRQLLLSMSTVVALDVTIWALGIADKLEASLFFKPIAYQYRIGTAMNFYGSVFDLLNYSRNAKAPISTRGPHSAGNEGSPRNQSGQRQTKLEMTVNRMDEKHASADFPVTSKSVTQEVA
ncbi:hypothetical protein DFJ77DRAFT_472111 [Powellomyces hirtus]|nr:hypothetical protein DFJ77DRAFT_472111 [Powellomyces hirtus]